jgi:Permease for cytosine/purines, uracil, thiamine, allantoin
MFALDLVIAYNASWLPLAPDYTRYSADRFRAALGAALGYFAGTSLVMVIGLLAATLSAATSTTTGAILALSGFAGGFIATAVVVADESEKTFANVYSTAVSFQNLAPRCPQRLAIIVISTIATLIAYRLSVSDYINFLYLLGAIFVPLFGAVIADWLDQPAPLVTVAAWIIGFLAYEWLNPSQVAARRCRPSRPRSGCGWRRRGCVGCGPRWPRLTQRRQGTAESRAASASSASAPAVGMAPRRARQRSCGTRHTASATIRRVIFDPPATRSVKMIGTSTTR